MTGSGLETLPDVQEVLPDVRDWSAGYPGCPGAIGRPSRISGSGRVALPDVWEWSGDPPGCAGVVGRPSRMSGSGRETLPDVREWSGDPPG